MLSLKMNLENVIMESCRHVGHGGWPEEAHQEEKDSLTPSDTWIGRWEEGGREIWTEKRNDGGTTKTKHASCIFSQEERQFQNKESP